MGEKSSMTRWSARSDLLMRCFRGGVYSRRRPEYWAEVCNSVHHLQKPRYCAQNHFTVSQMSRGWLLSGFCQGFFCRTEDEFDDWCMRIRRVGFCRHCSHCPCQSSEQLHAAPQEFVTEKKTRLFFSSSCPATEAACLCLNWSTVSPPTWSAWMPLTLLLVNKLLFYCLIYSKNSMNWNFKLFLLRANSHSADFSDSDRLERFFDSEDEEFEILSLWGIYGPWFTVLDRWREILSPLCIRRETWRWTLLGDLLSQSSSDGVSHSALLNSHWMLSVSQLWDCLMEAVAGAQDKFRMHIFTSMCFYLSLNTFHVYFEVIWCLSLTP